MKPLQAVLLHDTVCLSIFYKTKFGLSLDFQDIWHSSLGVNAFTPRDNYGDM